MPLDQTEKAGNPFADPAGPSLADVLDRIASAQGPNPRQKREMSSAVNSASLWLHRTPAEIPASQEYFRRAFERMNYGTLGISRDRFRNVRSLMKQALDVAGIATSKKSYLAPLNPPWSELRGRITDRYPRDCLGRFLRFLSAQRIAPEHVDDSVVQRYREALIKEDMTAKPDVAVQSAVRLWNRMIDEVPGWPQKPLTLLRRRETYALSWDQLPPDLLAEIERYLAILGGDDPTHDLAPPRALKPRSIAKRRYELLQFVSALHHQGVQVGDLHGLADLCKVDRAKLALKYFIARHRKKHGEGADPAESTMIGGIADAIRALAKHYVQAPADTVRDLTRIASNLNRRRVGMSEKNRKRLAQLDSPEVERRLLCYPLIEMNKLARKNDPSRRDAIRYGGLLAMEIFINAPMRLDNLAHLDLDCHFTWPPRGGGDIGIVIPLSEVKNAQPLEYKIPKGSSTAAVQTYLDRFRPLLTRANSGAMFPGRRGDAKRNDTLSKQVIKLMRTELGIDWNPHLFRHLAVRLYLRAHPGDYEGARRLLAHLSAETTFRIYEGMAMRPAVDELDRIIESIRGPLPFTPSGGRHRPRRDLGKNGS